MRRPHITRACMIIGLGLFTVLASSSPARAQEPALGPAVEALPSEDVQVIKKTWMAQIEVSCDVPGAEISLDGEPLFTAPGRQRRMVSAGQHVLSARKPGYFPVTEPVSLISGQQTRVVLRMTADVVHVERRWQPWQPWAVHSTGVVTSLVGGILMWKARNDYAAIQSKLDACQPGSRCDQIPQRRLDQAIWSERIGTGALITGGTLVAVGLAGVLLNLPNTRRSEPAGDVEKLDISPIISGDTAGVSVLFLF